VPHRRAQRRRRHLVTGLERGHSHATSSADRHRGRGRSFHDNRRPFDWLDCGQALEAVLLRATILGLATSCLDQVLEIHELAAPRSRRRADDRVAASRHASHESNGHSPTVVTRILVIPRVPLLPVCEIVMETLRDISAAVAGSGRHPGRVRRPDHLDGEAGVGERLVVEGEDGLGGVGRLRVLETVRRAIDLA
jgi:hypothetical protein